jgi:hypothetical protein
MAYAHSYQDARKIFRETATSIGATVEDNLVFIDNDTKEKLTIDTATIGAPQPAWSVVISSGLHGVEGFFGSAIQIEFLRHIDARELAKLGGQFVFIRSINPFGFFMCRRANEDNVDLNRNFFLDGVTYSGASDGYRELNEFLNPKAAPRALDGYLPRILWKISRVGLDKLKQAVAEGQYEFPRGIFFGGAKLAKSTQILQQNMLRWVRGQHIVHLDFHSGLGTHAKYKLLIPPKSHSDRLAQYNALFGPDVEKADATRTDKSQPIAYDVRGDFGQYMLASAKGVDYLFLFAEVGTQSPIKVLGALRQENQAHFYAPKDSTAYVQAKARLLECFCPASMTWRRSVLKEGIELIHRAQQAATVLASSNLGTSIR